jgi:hypothetical protein
MDSILDFYFFMNLMLWMLSLVTGILENTLHRLPLWPEASGMFYFFINLSYDGMPGYLGDDRSF